MHVSNIDSDVIARFAEAVDRMAQNLASWSPFFQRLTHAETMRFLALGQSADITSATVRSIITARRLRDEHFWPSMNEAAWTLMLEMFAGSLIGERKDTGALSETTGIDPEDVLYWIDWLAARGIVHRQPDPGAAAEVLVDLTDEGADRMRAYLLASLELSPWVV